MIENRFRIYSIIGNVKEKLMHVDFYNMLKIL